MWSVDDCEWCALNKLWLSGLPQEQLKLAYRLTSKSWRQRRWRGRGQSSRWGWGGWWGRWRWAGWRWRQEVRRTRRPWLSHHQQQQQYGANNLQCSAAAVRCSCPLLCLLLYCLTIQYWVHCSSAWNWWAALKQCTTRDSSKTWLVLTAALSATCDRTHAKFSPKITSSAQNYWWRNEYWWGTIWVEWTLCPAAWVDLVLDWQWWKYKWACPTHHTFDFFIQVKC